MSFSALLVALAVSIVPTVLYLGLWRGLVRLRENALARYGDAHDLGQPAASPRSASPRSASSGSRATVDCPNCGTGNDDYARFCAACLRKL